MQKWLREIRLHVAFSPQKIVILIFIFVSLCSLAFQIFGYFTDNSYTSPRHCVDSQAAIVKQVGTLQNCKSDEECILLKANCPFNCHAINKQASITALISSITAYTKECGICVSECTTTTPRCVNSQCVL